MKKIFTISLLSLALIGCVSEKEQEENNDETSITPPVINIEGNTDVLTANNSNNNNVNFVFSNNTNSNCESGSQSENSFLYSFKNISSNNNIERVTLDIKYNYKNADNPSKDIESYIKNIQTIEEVEANFENRIMNSNCPKVALNFEFDDLPANFLEDPSGEDSYSENSYIVKDAVTLTLTIYTSKLDPIKEDININVENSNTSPATERIELITKTVQENNDTIIFEDIYDENFNDMVAFRLDLPESSENLIDISYENHPEIAGTGYKKLYKTQSDIDNKSLNSKLNLIISTKEISSVTPHTLNFSIIVTDFYPLNDTEYKEKSIPVSITIENTEEDLFPSLTVNSTETISETNGGRIDFSVSNSNDYPNAPLSVNYSLSIDNAQYSENFVFNETENTGYLELSDINISGNQEGLLTLTVDDGINTVSKEILVTLQEDLDRNPTIVINGNNTINISEENGGTISFSAQNNNPDTNSLSLSYDITLPNNNVNVSLNEENQTISFSNINIQNDYSTTLTVTASDGVATVSDTVNVVFVDDIDSEFLEFKADYENEKLKYSEIQRNDELVIFNFVKEFSQIQYLQSDLINQYETQVNQFLNSDQIAIDNLVSQIDGFIAKENSYTEQEFDAAKANLNEMKIQVSNYGLESLDAINDLISETNILPLLITSKNELNDEGYYSRYVGNSAYGTYLDQERRLWQFNDEFKFLELVNVQNGQCN
tara:strand:- start:15674 stop:17824 length:2151 start_codon:yes stop_codon:yes gene_type:complete